MKAIVATPFRFLVLITVLGLGAACSPAGGDLGSAATPLPTPGASVDVPSPEPTPGSPEVTPAPSLPTPTGAPSASPSPTGTTTVRAYFFLGNFTDNAGLAPVLREIPKTQAVATAAMNALLAGPNDREMGARPAMYTTIPEGTRLLGLSIADGVATVDLSREFESGGGAASMTGRLAQVVYTLTQYPTVDSVRFMLDGEPVTVFGGEGIILDKPVDRADYVDQLPAIFVDRPAWGAAGGNPIRIAGNANVFEAQFLVALADAKGGVLFDKPVMASCGTGCRGTFDVTFAYSVKSAQWGTLRVYDRSAKDGSVENVTEYPVWLTPAK